MVKKSAVGKLQFVIGIVLLAGSAIGGLLTYINFNDKINSIINLGIGQETDSLLVKMSSANILLSITATLTIICSISFITSFLFITQGLVNLSNK